MLVLFIEICIKILSYISDPCSCIGDDMFLRYREEASMFPTGLYWRYDIEIWYVLKCCHRIDGYMFTRYFF
jgi:hypothetical protein